MSGDRKFKTLLDQQISAWFMKREKSREEERHIEGHRVSMECVEIPNKRQENSDAV